MAIVVKFTNNDDGGILSSGFAGSEAAEQYIQDAFCEDEELAGDILQVVEILPDGEEVVLAEYVREEFDC